MILVTQETTAEDLHSAVLMLMRARHAFGIVVQREMRAHRPPADETDVTTAEIVAARDHLAQVRTAPEREVTGFGLTRSIFIRG